MIDARVNNKQVDQSENLIHQNPRTNYKAVFASLGKYFK